MTVELIFVGATIASYFAGLLEINNGDERSDVARVFHLTFGVYAGLYGVIKFAQFVFSF